MDKQRPVVVETRGLAVHVGGHDVAANRRITRQGRSGAGFQRSIEPAAIECTPSQIPGARADRVAELDKRPVILGTMPIGVARDVMGAGDDVADGRGVADIRAALKPRDEMDPGRADPFFPARVV